MAPVTVDSESDIAVDSVFSEDVMAPVTVVSDVDIAPVTVVSDVDIAVVTVDSEVVDSELVYPRNLKSQKARWIPMLQCWILSPV